MKYSIRFFILTSFIFAIFILTAMFLSNAQSAMPGTIAYAQLTPLPSVQPSAVIPATGDPSATTIWSSWIIWVVFGIAAIALLLALVSRNTRVDKEE